MTIKGILIAAGIIAAALLLMPHSRDGCTARYRNQRCNYATGALSL